MIGRVCERKEIHDMLFVSNAVPHKACKFPNRMFSSCPTRYNNPTTMDMFCYHAELTFFFFFFFLFFLFFSKETKSITTVTLWALDFHVDGGGGVPLGLGGRKPEPVAMRSVHKKYTLSQYTLLKICILVCIPCRNIAPSLVPRSRACHKHCGLGTPGKQPWDKRSSPPVAN